MLTSALPTAARHQLAWAADVVLWSHDLLVVVFPQGGQARSRRNAWQAMAGEAAHAAARRDSEVALRTASLRAGAATQPAAATAD